MAFRKAIAIVSGLFQQLQAGDGVDVQAGLLLTNASAPATPASGTTAVYVDSTTKQLSAKDDAGTVTAAVGQGQAYAVARGYCLQ